MGIFSEVVQWVGNVLDDELLLLAILLLIICGVSFFCAFSRFYRKRIIEDTPTAKIRSASQGYVELVGYGHLIDGQPITSPFSGNTCLWYEYQVEERSATSQGTEWRTVRSGASDSLFLLKDETGQCIIDPEGASVTVKDSYVWYGNSDMPSSRSPAVRKISGLNKSISPGGFRGGFNQYRYTEKLLYPGGRLYAIGLYETIGGAGTTLDFKADVSALLREWKQDMETLMKRFDTNKDDKLSVQEWQKAREAAYQEVKKEYGARKKIPPINRIGKTNDSRRPFILSAVEQNTLTRKLHLHSMLWFALFWIGGIAAFYLISLRLAS